MRCKHLKNIPTPKEGGKCRKCKMWFCNECMRVEVFLYSKEYEVDIRGNGICYCCLNKQNWLLNFIYCNWNK